MGMGFLASVIRVENEDDDPVGAAPDPDDPITILTREAARVGLIKEGDKPDQMLVDFWMSAVDASAAIADRFREHENDRHTLGDLIRAELSLPLST
ncbi:hypothetical protein QTH87_25630 [Variovorax sp. J22P168]|uniref:hypothetical protein n=1 Tax=Variovorax jilinensis TaxID=3053513 RepID=UPI002577D62B|nr:hypothetical protein [Variovorax sp. J22P168]MDM0015846.1 hypothetical protein [Variovorax sp. J22P168]